VGAGSLCGVLAWLAPLGDYRRSYSARSDLGGGALLTVCHPSTGSLALVPRGQHPLVCKPGGFLMDVDDCADVVAVAGKGATATVHVDYYQRPRPSGSVWPRRWMVEGDFPGGRLQGWSRRGEVGIRECVPAGWERNDMFMSR